MLIYAVRCKNGHYGADDDYFDFFLTRALAEQYLTREAPADFFMNYYIEEVEVHEEAT